MVIIVAGAVLVMVIIFRAVLDFLLYRKKMAIMASFEIAAKNMEKISSYFSAEVVKPLSQIIAVFQGISQGIGAIRNIFK